MTGGFYLPLVGKANALKHEVLELHAQLDKDKLTLNGKIDETLRRAEDLASAIGALKQEMNNKMSISKYYRMKSLLGEWWGSVFNGRGENGGAMAIVPRATADWNYPNNTAMWWTFEEKP